MNNVNRPAAISKPFPEATGKGEREGAVLAWSDGLSSPGGGRLIRYLGASGCPYTRPRGSSLQRLQVGPEAREAIKTHLNLRTRPPSHDRSTLP
jgi:hypothetical protein